MNRAGDQDKPELGLAAGTRLSAKRRQGSGGIDSGDRGMTAREKTGRGGAREDQGRAAREKAGDGRRQRIAIGREGEGGEKGRETRASWVPYYPCRPVVVDAVLHGCACRWGIWRGG